MKELDTHDRFDAIVREALRDDAELAPRLPAEWPGPTAITVVPIVTRQSAWKYLAVSAAAAVVLVAGLVVVVRQPDDTPAIATPVTPPPAVSPPAMIAFIGDFEITGRDGSRPPYDDLGDDFLSDIFVVDKNGGGLRNLTNTPDVNESAPTWSPDGRRLAFIRDLRAGSARLVVFDTATQTETIELDVPLHPRSDLYGSLTWSSDGSTIDVHIANAPVHRLDLASRAWTEHPQGVGHSPDGRWVTWNDNLSDGSAVPFDLVIVPADQFDETAFESSPAVYADSHDATRIRFEQLSASAEVWSPDGTKLLVPTRSETSDSPPDACTGLITADERIDIVEIPSGERRVFVEHASVATWSPQGDLVAFLRNPSPRQGWELWVAAANGSNERPVAWTTIAPSWSTDGSRLLAATQDGLFTVVPDGTNTDVLTTGMPVGGPPICAPNTADTPLESPAWQPTPTRPTADEMG